MLFLYWLLTAKLSSKHNPSKIDSSANELTDPDDEAMDPTNNLENFDRTFIRPSGPNERVNTYLNYIGLSSSRRTAQSALASLGKGARAKLMGCFDLALSPTLSPLVCFDNLDFQEKIHMKGISHSSQMFHGTWGYMHLPPPSLLAKLDKDQLTIDAMNAALHDASKITIQPDMFTPTLESSAHFKLTIKSQITRATLRYYALPIDSRIQLHKNPPEVQPIEPYDPQICMLKLMVASDNSAIGVGEVFTGLIQQSGLTPAEFHSRLQILEGDLGSCNIFNSLWQQRIPAADNESSLNNVLPIPGAANTHWNVSQAIFLAHWGDEKNSRDTGAWRTLHALGIPANQPVTKKD
ncbi:hypothetical protein PCANC_12726 [Puccinia coronata f. sp. avenae]|uniref:DUF6589 domain-containing protein n=1 Tax=Puccinia coronata f. sp. avenae TaxID=200324 RepID=A0A2N5U170_9BASI|nr:hypothetical protein PCANC_12726 [Puccinia coronata f. sp. avenae]PLW31485.1 hypothetical protein PCASD_17868 [Puccinia coronata f. sp. avenae]